MRLRILDERLVIKQNFKDLFVKYACEISGSHEIRG